MEIRQAIPSDLPELRRIYDDARKFMQLHGNRSQWSNGYPGDEIIRGDSCDVADPQFSGGKAPKPQWFGACKSKGCS